MPAVPVRVLACAVAAALAAGVAGCSSAPAGALALAWQLADGRDCYSAGIVVVQPRTAASLGTAPLATFDCADGVPPKHVMLDSVPGRGTLYLDGRSGQGADLYHGELSLDDNPPGTGALRLVTLYAVAAQ
jgi:hypothetical protein